MTFGYKTDTSVRGTVASSLALCAFVDLCCAVEIVYDPRRLLHRVVGLLRYWVRLVVSEIVQGATTGGLAS